MLTNRRGEMSPEKTQDSAFRRWSDWVFGTDVQLKRLLGDLHLVQGSLRGRSLTPPRR